jgi:large subunit ribosomal protein L33
MVSDCHFASHQAAHVLLMAKNKGVRIVITLECTECRSNPAKRSPGVSRYTSQKNRRNTTERLELKKFCPHCNKSTVHKEIK